MLRRHCPPPPPPRVFGPGYGPAVLGLLTVWSGVVLENRDFIEIKVDFIEKKVGKMKRKKNQTWPYYATRVEVHEV